MLLLLFVVVEVVSLLDASPDKRKSHQGISLFLRESSRIACGSMVEPLKDEIREVVKPANPDETAPTTLSWIVHSLFRGAGTAMRFKSVSINE